MWRSADYTLDRLVVVDGRGFCCAQGELGVGDSLPGDRLWRRAARWWPVLLALAATIALAIGGQHWFASSGHSKPVGESAASLAQRIADAATAAFSGSTTITVANPAVTPDQRTAGLPVDPVAGLTSVTPAGPVQLVLPDGLDTGRRTSSGSMVYPDHGAGFDFVAENTGTGTRTVARVNSPTGVRMVTTFVRTPADTVMLAHADGFVTINRATATAETIGMFAPAETRDAAAQLVPSSYVVRRLRPGLYQFSEVIDPRSDTAWPVFVDPPLHVGGVFDSIAGTESSAAVIVAGAAVAVTGVGGPAGAAAIAAAAVNVGAAGRQLAAEAMPDNHTLGVVSTIANTATMLTPGGAAKKIAEEGADIIAKQVLTQTDDVIDAAKAVPNPAQLHKDIAAVGSVGSTDLGLRSAWGRGGRK